MPSSNNTGFLIGLAPVVTITGTVYINSGTAIAAGASITDTYTFTGAATTDINFGISPRPQNTATPPTFLQPGLQLTSLTVSSTNTLTAVWTNTTGAPITPPVSSTWTYAVFNEYFR